MEENKEEKTINEKVKEQVEIHINALIKNGLQSGNIELLGKLVDIHKDLENEEYWKEKKEVMKNDVRKLWKARIWK